MEPNGVCTTTSRAPELRACCSAESEAVSGNSGAGSQVRRTRPKPATVIPTRATAAAAGRNQLCCQKCCCQKRCCQNGMASASSASTSWSDSAAPLEAARDASPAVAQARLISSAPIWRDALRSRRSTKPCTSRSANQASRSAPEASTSRYPGNTSRSSQARQYSHCAANRSPGWFKNQA